MAKIKDLLGVSVQPNSSILGGRFSASNLNREATDFDIKAMKDYGFPLTPEEVTYSQKYPDGYAKTVKNYGGQTLNSDQRMLSRLSSAQQQELAKANPDYAKALSDMKLISQYTTAAKSAAGKPTSQVGGAEPGITSSSASSLGSTPTVESEIKRAQDVWANADSLAGTGKYKNKTADQIRNDAHAYAESLRAGGPIQPPTIPAGWDAQSYANFKTANPNLEPNAQDTQVQQGTQTPPPGTAYDQSGKLVFSTGNPQFDQFLNGEYAKSWEAELNGQDPNTFFNSDAFKTIKERVDKTWGPKFAQDLADAQASFDLTKAGTLAEKAKTEAELGLQKARTVEDLAIATTRQARNYAQAQEESKLAMAARKLTFGGSRAKAEANLAATNAEQLGALQTTAKRSLEDIQAQSKYALGDTTTGDLGAYGRQLAGQQSQFDIKKREIAGELPVKYAEERANIRTLGGNILSNPEFFPKTLTK